MNSLFIVFLSLSVSGSIIALLLLVLKPLFKEKLTKTWQYYIWLIVIFRLLIPFTPEVSIVGNLFNLEIDYATTPSNVISPIVSPDMETKTLIKTEQQKESQDVSNVTEGITKATSQPKLWESVKNYIWLVWLIVAVALFIRKVWWYHVFAKNIKKNRIKCSDASIYNTYHNICMSIGIRKPPSIYKCSINTAPMLVGVFRPFLVLPDSNMSTTEIQYVFMHELTHFKRIDIFYKWIIQTAICLHWFNPFVYLIGREINKNCELSCDETVVKQLDNNERYDYGETLISTVEYINGYMKNKISISLNEDTKLLKERLDAIMKFRKKSKINSISSIVLAVIIFSSAALTGAYANDKAPLSTKDLQVMAPASTDNFNDMPDIKDIKDLNLTVKDCNLIIRKSPDKKFSINYNKEQYQTSYETNGTSLNISISGNPDNDLTSLDDELTLFQKVIINLPDASLNSITVKNKDSGVEFQEIDANLNINCEKGSAGFYLPSGFNKQIDLHCVEGAATLNLYGDSKNYTLNITPQDSAVKIPDKFHPIKFNKKYQYVNGNGKAKINIEAIESSLEVKIIDQSLLYSPYRTYGLTVEKSSGRDILYYNGIRLKLFYDEIIKNKFTLYTDPHGLLAVRATRDTQGKLSGIEIIPRNELEKLLQGKFKGALDM